MGSSRFLKINLLTVAAVIAAYVILNSFGVAWGGYCLLSLGNILFICPLGFFQRPSLVEATTHTTLIGLAITLALIALHGRIFCGWICPIGIGLRLLKHDKGNGRGIILVFSISMASMLITSWILGFPIFCLVCPIGIVSRIIASALAGSLDLWSILWGIIIFAVITLVLRIRNWCGGVCPLGALQALLSPLKILRIKVSSRCTRCRICARSCPLGLEIHEDRVIDYMSCTACMKCIAECPFKALKPALSSPLSSMRSRG
ncbi:MAG: 4Fe-4S binding protein [Aigarchaeota archaeon]|nr:4Fe-4S binding protein [Candidatus Wolframiiraptor gerlachensis]